MISEKEKLILFMSMFEVANKQQETILEIVDDYSVESVLRNPDVLQILPKDKFQQLAGGYDKRTLDSAVENLEKAGIKILTIFSDEYPSKLFNLPERPLILFAKGDLSLLNRKCLAVVGTRFPTNYGKIITERYVEKLAKSGFVIVSGLCFGVDAIAHRKTLEVGGKTIAVTGGGFNHIYPATNTSLAEEIAEKGLLLSEYPPSFVAKKYTFPRRNRIVVGISDGVLITEAGLKSGTLHSKEFALEYGKDIFAVPGNVNSEKSELPNNLIKTAQAECVLDADDIIEYYGMQKVAKSQKVLEVSFDEKTVLDILAKGELDFDTLAEKSKIPVNILNSCLTTLEIRGLIRRLPAKTYSLK